MQSWKKMCGENLQILQSIHYIILIKATTHRASLYYDGVIILEKIKFNKKSISKSSLKT